MIGFIEYLRLILFWISFIRLPISLWQDRPCSEHSLNRCATVFINPSHRWQTSLIQLIKDHVRHEIHSFASFYFISAVVEKWAISHGRHKWISKTLCRDWRNKQRRFVLHCQPLLLLQDAKFKPQIKHESPRVLIMPPMLLWGRKTTILL